MSQSITKTASFDNLNGLNEECKSNPTFGSNFLYLTKDNGTITFTFTTVLAGYSAELDTLIAAYSDPTDPHTADMPVSIHKSTSDPTVNDDIEKGYEAGCCHWLNTSNGKYFICKDSSAGAADWDEVSFV